MGQRHLIELRKILIDRFDEGELRTLCFDLGVDYDSLAGEGKANKARELVTFVERRGRISELIRVGMQLRPDISWSGVLAEIRATPPPERSVRETEWVPATRRVSEDKVRPWWDWVWIMLLLGAVATWGARTLLYLYLRSEPTYEYTQAVDYSNFLAIGVGAFWLGLTIYVARRAWQRSLR